MREDKEDDKNKEKLLIPNDTTELYLYRLLRIRYEKSFKIIEGKNRTMRNVGKINIQKRRFQRCTPREQARVFFCHLPPPHYNTNNPYLFLVETTQRGCRWICR